MSEKEYQIVNGTSYHKETPKEVIKWLETSRERRQRIRVFYGDTKTGKDWKEENDTQGHIGRSTGTNKIPLMIKSSRSYGGSAVLDHRIVKITTYGSDRKIHVVYQHEKYKLWSEVKVFEFPEMKNPFVVEIDGETHASFKTKEQAENYILFLKGERNKI